MFSVYAPMQVSAVESAITNLELVTGFSTLVVDDNLVAFSVPEYSQGNTDLNGDGDTGNPNDDDKILHIYDHSTGETTNLRLDEKFPKTDTILWHFE